MMTFRCRILLISVLLGLSSVAHGEVPRSPRADASFIAERLVGTWRLSPELSEQLTSSPGGSFDLFVITSDPSLLAKTPYEARAAAGSDVFFTGTLTAGDSRFACLMGEGGGMARLACYRSPADGKTVRVLSIHFALIPARERSKDLLFLGGENLGEPFFAYEREKAEASKSLSEETRRLLKEALDESFSPAWHKLPAQPDWQAVIDSILEELRLQPEGDHNNRLLVLAAVLAQHRSEAKLDLDPLLGVLASRRWTNQQKAAKVLSEAVLRRELFNGKEEQVCRVLIPLTTSQRGPVVSLALQVLHALSGETRIQRDPVAWSAWFEKTYGKQIPLAESVYELVGTIQARKVSPGQEAFSFNNSPPVEADGLRAKIKDHLQVARENGLHATFVILVPRVITSAATESEALEAARPVQRILSTLGVESFTVAPEGTEFFEPFRPGFPKGH